MQEPTNFVQKDICPVKLNNHLVSKYHGAVRYCQETGFPMAKMIGILEGTDAPDYEEYLHILVSLRIMPLHLSIDERSVKDIIEDILFQKFMQMVYKHDDGGMSDDEFSRSTSRFLPFIHAKRRSIESGGFDAREFFTNLSAARLAAREGGDIPKGIDKTEWELLQMLEGPTEDITVAEPDESTDE